MYVGKEMLLEDAAKLKNKLMLCGIYSIINKINGKVYVGQSKSIYKRASEHVTSKGSNEYLQRAIKKYGIEKFVHKIEVLCKEEELAVNENIAFDKYAAAGIVMYNIAKCGFGGNTLKFATEERKKEIYNKINNTKNNKSQQDKETINKKISSTLKNKTKEDKIVITTARINKFTPIIEGVIKVCLQNKLFTFGKYRKYCKANNLELQVSISYFGIIMQFARHKEELHEFVTIYKDNMDYNTYSSLCKLKPICKSFYKFTVMYSTYKYFI